MRLILILLALCFVYKSHLDRSWGACTGCKSNLKNLACSLEMWASDHHGNYPRQLAQLSPFYLRQIPTCPAAGRDTYSQLYRGGKDYYATGCAGENHPGLLPPNCPAYTATRGPLIWISPPKASPKLPATAWALLCLLPLIGPRKR